MGKPNEIRELLKGEQVTSITFSPDGRSVFVGMSDGIQTRNAEATSLDLAAKRLPLTSLSPPHHSFGAQQVWAITF